MTDRPILSYDPQAGGRPDAATLEGQTFDVSPHWSPLRWGLSLTFFVGLPAMIWWHDLLRGTFVERFWAAVHILAAAMTGGIVNGFIRCRAVMRIDGGGFVLEQKDPGWRSTVTDVRWPRVKDVFVASRRRWEFEKPAQWLRIELFTPSRQNITTLELMQGHACNEIEAVADELDRWRQNAAAATPAVR